MDRQLRLNRNGTTLDLTSSPYKLEAGSWDSNGEAVSFGLVVQATSLVQLDRYAANVRRFLEQAAAYEQELIGDAVYVETKTCDDLTTTAEFGATWMRKRIVAGNLAHEDPGLRASGQYTLSLSVSLATEAIWRRAAPESVLEASSASTTIGTDGSLTVPASATLTARRVTWTATTGLSVRVRWTYSDNNCTFFFAETGLTDVRALYQASDNKLYMYDDAGSSTSSSALMATAGDELDIVFVWHHGSTMKIYVNGTKVSGGVLGCTLDVADTYQVFAPSTAAQTLLSWQCWPAVLTDAECADLYAWGRPEPELLYAIAPADDKATNAHYKLYNAPGDAPGNLRLMLASSGSDQDQIRVGLRPLRVQTKHLWECESGTLDAGTTADNANADASAGHQARFTPADTTTGTRVTVIICADPDDVAAMQGEYRLLLAGYDSAAGVGVNLIKWRLVVAGKEEDYSDEFSFAAVSTRSVLDLGILSIPPGAWPTESISATTDIHAGSYITLELAVRNTTGSGGGTLDMDALYLFPAEREGIWTGDFDISAVQAVIDHTSDPAAAVTIANKLSLEFAGWATWIGDFLRLIPVNGSAGSLCLYWYRNGTEQAFPNDTSDVYIYYQPRWSR